MSNIAARMKRVPNPQPAQANRARSFVLLGDIGLRPTDNTHSAHDQTGADNEGGPNQRSPSPTSSLNWNAKRHPSRA